MDDSAAARVADFLRDDRGHQAIQRIIEEETQHIMDAVRIGDREHLLQVIHNAA